MDNVKKITDDKSEAAVEESAAVVEENVAVVEESVAVAGDLVEAEMKPVDALMAKGMEQFLSQKYTAAADIFSQVSELAATEYGDAAIESAEPFYYYGLTLYLSALTKTDLFGESIAQDEQASEPSKPLESKSDSEYESDTSSIPDNIDEADDMELAWQLLDSARLIYSPLLATLTSTQLTILADIHMTLGDISAESCAWALAVEDYIVSLDMKRGMLDEGNRQLAEIHYKIALGYEYLKEFEKMKEHLEASVCVLRMKISKLVKASGGKGKERISATTTAASDDEFHKEIKELESLLPELEECNQNLDMRKNPLNLVPLEGESINLLTGSPAPQLKQNVSAAGTPTKSKLNEVLSSLKPKAPVVINNVNSLIKSKKTNTDATITDVSGSVKRKVVDQTAQTPEKKAKN